MIKKNSSAKVNGTVISILSVIGAVILIFILISLSYQPGVSLSCKTGEFEGFVKIGTPMSVAQLTGSCSGNVLIRRNETEEIICNESGDSLAGSEIVQIRCPELKKYKNIELDIIYYTFSDEYGNKTGFANEIY